MKKILFVSYGGGHINLLLPVFKKLYFDDNYQCKFLALTTAANVLKKNKLPYFGFKDLIDDENRLVIEVGKSLVGNENDDSIVPYDESVAYMGLSYCDLIDHYGDEEAKNIYEKYGRHAFYPLRTLKKYLVMEKPDLVVATSAPRAERAAIDAASQLNIPSICIVDLFAFKEIEWVGAKGFSDKVCVISNYVKEKMLKAGRCTDEVEVTGNPAFDELLSYQDKHKIRSFRRSKKWADSEKVVLWASSIEPEHHPYSDVQGDISLPLKIEKELNELVNNNPNIRLVIRPHPNDKRMPLVESDRVDVSTQDDNLNLLLNAVDCVIVLSSTVGMQAAFLKKALVNINLSIFSADAPYDKMGLSSGVNDLNDLNSIVLEALKCETRENTLLPIGSATNNVIDVIKRLL